MLRFDPSELRKYAGLTLLARNVVEGFLTGVHRSPFKGFSIEFAEHRQYAPGDEIRRIDSRTFGKTDRYYIKEYEEETNLKAYLLVDASGSMAYKGKGKHPSKFQYAQYVAASLSFLMLHRARCRRPDHARHQSAQHYSAQGQSEAFAQHSCERWKKPSPAAKPAWRRCGTSWPVIT